MRFYAFSLSAILIFLVIALPGFSIGCQGGTCECGETLTGNSGEVYTLSENDGIVSTVCFSGGLRLDSPGITLDCAGNRLIGYYNFDPSNPNLGIFLDTNSAGSEVRDCEIIDFDIGIESAAQSHIIHNNTIFGSMTGLGIPGPLYGIRLQGSNSNVYDNNVHDVQTGIFLSGTPLYGLLHLHGVHNNQISFASMLGIKVDRSNAVNLHDNYIYFSGTSGSSLFGGVLIVESAYSIIENNEISVGTPYGVIFNGSNTGTKFRFNDVKNNGVGMLFDNADTPFVLSPDEQLIVEQNNISFNSVYGAKFVSGNSGLNFTKNSLEGNGAGMMFSHATGFFAEENTVKDSYNQGAFFEGSAQNVVFRFNRLLNNLVGMYVDPGASNLQANENKICYNRQFDVKSDATSASVSGWYNMCDSTLGWTDSNSQGGCSYACVEPLDGRGTIKIKVDCWKLWKSGKLQKSKKFWSACSGFYPFVHSDEEGELIYDFEDKKNKNGESSKNRNLKEAPASPKTIVEDTDKHNSRGGYNRRGTLFDMGRVDADAGTLTITYGYDYKARTNGRTAYVYTYIDNVLVDTNAFKTPKCAGGYCFATRTFSAESGANPTIRFDYKNGDYGVDIGNIKIIYNPSETAALAKPVPVARTSIPAAITTAATSVTAITHRLFPTTTSIHATTLAKTITTTTTIPVQSANVFTTTPAATAAGLPALKVGVTTAADKPALGSKTASILQPAAINIISSIKMPELPKYPLTSIVKAAFDVGSFYEKAKSLGSYKTR